ncbi:MAG: response regulator transcription factor [Desulfuromonadales bacterium]|nr:response regulator transcription factor [Desulfuromonadales bacterium]
MNLSAIVCCRVHLYAEGLQRLLEDDDDLKILGVASTDEEIRNLMQYNPDIIISDLACCKKVLEILPSGDEKKVLLVNDAGDLSSEDLKDMIADGLGGILPKDADGRLLRKAAQKLHGGELWIDHQTMREVLSHREEKKQDIHLTKKETEILNYICTGHTNKEIARKLYISEQTVKSHCNHLFKKFGVSSRLKLALTAPECAPESLKSSMIQ